MIRYYINKYGIKNKQHLLKNNICDICYSEYKNHIRKKHEIRNAYIVVVKKNRYGLKLCKHHLASYWKQKNKNIYVMFNNFIHFKP